MDSGAVDCALDAGHIIRCFAASCGMQYRSAVVPAGQLPLRDSTERVLAALALRCAAWRGGSRVAACDVFAAIYLHQEAAASRGDWHAFGTIDIHFPGA